MAYVLAEEMFHTGNYGKEPSRGWRGGYGRGSRGGRGRGRGRQNNQEAVGHALANLNVNEEVPEGLIEPCKVYVGNLRQRVGEKDLHKALSHYVPVVKAIIIKDKITKRSRGYGFVTVGTEEDVQTLLNLKDGHRYIQGQEMVIRPAKKRVVVPGDDDFVRRPFPDRDFDLSQPDPNQPSIHMLVDDVLYKIMEYLSVPELVRCERVCRRWQMLVHGMFTKMNSLEIAPGKLGLFGPVTGAILGKLLLLAGPTLKSLKVQSVDYCSRRNVLKIIGQLCPVLQCLDVTQALGINFQNISALKVSCRNLKSFIAKKCPEFGEKALQQLLASYPELERLDISGCSVTGKCLNILPTTLKELVISNCLNIGPSYLKEIGSRCPLMSILEMDECVVSEEVLEHIGMNCPNIKRLSVSIRIPTVNDSLVHFKKLKDLAVDTAHITLPNILENMPDLETLAIVDKVNPGGETDFSILKKLKAVIFYHLALTSSSLRSLAKCPSLETVHLQNCTNVTNEILLDILRGCASIKKIRCPNVDLNLSFISTANKIMEGRSGKVVIEVRADSLSAKELLEAQYDNTKIAFDIISCFPFLDDFCDDGDDESLYSDGSFDDFWMYGYDSDHSLPDALFYGDHLDFLHNPFDLYGFGDDYEGDSDFSN
ncbi:F-box/LRR-repeat protein 7 isoform X2 [Procambarus clarkii]|uniref:F-box/LRR-repeat protein 7 isoform X2 n=1 Tax=Procambarus clarkii TaxID=6728 RepID=UPI001E678ECE|nr:uncharacterized protein LOC123755727 isoform X1 [Procambarus clarkii]